MRPHEYANAALQRSERLRTVAAHVGARSRTVLRRQQGDPDTPARRRGNLLARWLRYARRRSPRAGAFSPTSRWVTCSQPSAATSAPATRNSLSLIVPTTNYGAMRPGDVLLTHAATRAVHDARRRARGVRVFAFTCPYVGHSGWPRGQIMPPEDGLLLEDVADRVVESHVPWEQGLVWVPGRSEFPVLPASSSATCSIFWMLSAEVAERLVPQLRVEPAIYLPLGAQAERYLDFVLCRLEAVRAAY